MSDDSHDLHLEGRTPNQLLDELGSLKALLDEEHAPAAPYTSVGEIGSVEEYLRLKQAASAAGLGIDAYLAQRAESSTIDGDEEELLLLEAEDVEPTLLDDVVDLDEETGHDGDALLLELAEEEEEQPASSAALTVEEYFRAVVAAKHRQQPRQVNDPVLQEVVESPHMEAAIPLLDETVEEEPPATLHAASETEEGDIPLLDEVISAGDEIPVLAELAPQENDIEQGALSLEEMEGLVDLIVQRKLERLKPELEREVMGELQKLLPLSALTKH